MTSIARSPRLWELPRVWLAVLIAAAAIAAFVWLVANDVDDAGTSTAETAFAEAVGPPLPRPVATDAAGATDPAIGQRAPVISAQSIDGERVQLLYDGTGRVLGFFAHWCGHCQAEMPELAAWLENATIPDGVEVVAISTSVDATAENYPPSDWFAREGWPATAIVDSDDSALASAYGLRTFPYWVVIDGDGEVVNRVEGRIGATELAQLVESAGS